MSPFFQASLYSPSFCNLLPLLGCDSLKRVCATERADWLTVVLALYHPYMLCHLNVFSNRIWIPSVYQGYRGIYSIYMIITFYCPALADDMFTLLSFWLIQIFSIINLYQPNRPQKQMHGFSFPRVNFDSFFIVICSELSLQSLHYAFSFFLPLMSFLRSCSSYMEHFMQVLYRTHEAVL